MPRKLDDKLVAWADVVVAVCDGVCPVVPGKRNEDWCLPDPGTPTQPVEAGFMANAWIRLKHPDYDELRRMLDVVGQTVKVRAH